MWPDTRLPKIFARSAATLTCSTTRSSPNANKWSNSPARAFNATSVYIPYKKAGNGDLIKGFEKMNQMPYFEARKLVAHPVACIDCHDPSTMQLRVTRPGFIEGLRAFKASQGLQNYDVNTQATRQEMRAYVCGQCHVEYYFKGPEKRLVYPWAKGLKVEEIQAYYDEAIQRLDARRHGCPRAQSATSGVRDVESRSPRAFGRDVRRLPYALQARRRAQNQRPPRAQPGAQHQPRRQTCHKWPEEELKARVETIQERTHKLRNVAMDALMDLIKDLKAAKAAGKTDSELVTAQAFQRKAQFYLISSRPKTQRASTRRKRPHAFSASPLISPGKVRKRSTMVSRT